MKKQRRFNFKRWYLLPILLGLALVLMFSFGRHGRSGRGGDFGRHHDRRGAETTTAESDNSDRGDNREGRSGDDRDDRRDDRKKDRREGRSNNRGDAGRDRDRGFGRGIFGFGRLLIPLALILAGFALFWRGRNNGPQAQTSSDGDFDPPPTVEEIKIEIKDE
ncbi:MAG: hypothetical protein AAF614_22905 [Chloroflexota bacterium]